MNFMKKIFDGRPDEACHRQFTRFGKGEYGGRALLGMWRTGTGLKIKGSFEFANDFAIFAAGLKDMNFSGNIWSREEIEGLKGKKKEGKWIYEVENFSSSNVKNLGEKAYFFLLNADAEGVKLKIKAKLPKPGKGENKADEKFCQMELDGKYYRAAKDDFFWDMPEAKKISIEHKFMIKDIIFPKGEKDFAKIRETAKRKGRIIRTATADGKEIRSEKEFEA
jgi:hypothetical protein